MPETTTYDTLEDWLAEGRSRFGEDFSDWAFECPVCKNVATGAEFKAVGAEPNAMYQECIGRYLNMDKTQKAFLDSGEGPCDYAGYGLFRLSPVRVRHEDGHESHAFAFA